jgi:hypothetical protein
VNEKGVIFPQRTLRVQPAGCFILYAVSLAAACGRLSKATITTDLGIFHFANIMEAE